MGPVMVYLAKVDDALTTSVTGLKCRYLAVNGADLAWLTTYQGSRSTKMGLPMAYGQCKSSSTIRVWSILPSLLVFQAASMLILIPNGVQKAF